MEADRNKIESNPDSLGQFVKDVIRRKDISAASSQSLRFLRETLLEQQFENDFRPERDLIDYIRSKQRGVKTKFALATWRDEVSGVNQSRKLFSIAVIAL